MRSLLFYRDPYFHIAFQEKPHCHENEKEKSQAGGKYLQVTYEIQDCIQSAHITLKIQSRANSSVKTAFERRGLM